MNSSQPRFIESQRNCLEKGFRLTSVFKFGTLDSVMDWEITFLVTSSPTSPDTVRKHNLVVLSWTFQSDILLVINFLGSSSPGKFSPSLKSSPSFTPYFRGYHQTFSGEMSHNYSLRGNLTRKIFRPDTRHSAVLGGNLTSGIID